MKNTLRLILPRLAELHAGSELDFVLVDQARVLRQGRLPLAQIASATAAADYAAVLHPSDVVLADLPIPPVAGHHMRAAVLGAVEPLLLGESEELAIAHSARSAQGRVQLAWTERTLLARAWQLLAEHGLLVRQLVPAPLALPIPEQGILLACRDHTLMARHANGLAWTLALDPEADDNETDPVALVWLESLLDADSSPSLLEPTPPWLRLWRRQLLANDPSLPSPKDLPPEAGLSAPLPAWSLALTELRPRQLQKSPWRKPLLWVGAAAAVWLLGLNLYAWQLEREAEQLKARMISQVRTTFPQLPVVLDPLRQATQQRDSLQLASGNTANEDFLPLALSTTQLFEGPGTGIADIAYADGILTLSFTESGGAQRAALSADVLAKAQQLGLQVDEEAGRWQVQLRDSSQPREDGVAISPSARTTQQFERTLGAPR